MNRLRSNPHFDEKAKATNNVIVEFLNTFLSIIAYSNILRDYKPFDKLQRAQAAKSLRSEFVNVSYTICAICTETNIRRSKSATQPVNEAYLAKLPTI